MELKLNRRIFDVTDKDLILDNGACYQLITQTYHKDFYDHSPIVPKTTFKKLLKAGLIRLSKEKYKTTYKEYDLYEFVEQNPTS